MKKMIAVLLSLMLALSFSCVALAEEPAAPALTAGNWLQETLTTTDWIEKDGRATLEVAPVLDDQSEETFEVTVYCPDSATEGTQFKFYCVYDVDIHKLIAHSVLCYHLTYGEDGEVDLAENVYDRSTQATVEFGEDGLLTLSGDEDDMVSLIAFEPVPAPAFKGQELTEAQKADVAKLQNGLLGVSYEPECVIAEADDLVICILCKATVVRPGAEPYAVLMLINKNGDKPEVSFIQLTADDSEG